MNEDFDDEIEDSLESESNNMQYNSGVRNNFSQNNNIAHRNFNRPSNSQPIRRNNNSNINSKNSLNNDNTKDKGTKSKLQKAKKNVFGSLNQNRLRESNNTDDTLNPNDNNTNIAEKPAEIIAKVNKTILIVKVAIIAGIIGIIFFLMLVVITFVSNLFGMSLSFNSLNGGDGLGSIAEPGTPLYNAYQDYFKEIDKASDKFLSSYNIVLDRNFIHATLEYKYFISFNDGVQDEVLKVKIMQSNINKVADLMVKNGVTDTTRGGIFYTNLLNSSFLGEYYSDALKVMDRETIVKGIFDYAETGMQLANVSGGGYINDNLKVVMGTCEFPYNRELLNEGRGFSSEIGFRDYIKGVIYAETGAESITPESLEFVKAFAIVASSYSLNRGKYRDGATEIFMHNGNCMQLSCDIYKGCDYKYDQPGGYGTCYTGGGSYKQALSPSKKALLDQAVDSVFGTVMLTNSGEYKWASHYKEVNLNGKYCQSDCMGQDNALRDARNGMSYKDILNKYYINFKLSNLQEDTYTENVSYSNGGYTGEVSYYRQGDYKSTKFCGREGSTISSSGCGVTSMAMILSTFVDKSMNPVYVMNEASAARYCGPGISGTSPAFFQFSAAKHGLSYQKVSKTGNTQDVVNALRTGNSLVIAHMGPGTFTKSGHYIVLSKVNNNGQVYVLDPASQSRNGWHDFNSPVIKQLKGDLHIITKR